MFDTIDIRYPPLSYLSQLTTSFIKLINPDMFCRRKGVTALHADPLMRSVRAEGLQVHSLKVMMPER